MVKYWLRLHADKLNDALLLESLNDNMQMFKSGQDCWFKYIFTLLHDLNMDHIFNEPNKCKPKDVALLKRRLKSQFEDKWQANVFNSDKLRTYKQVKCLFKQEPYLTFVKNDIEKQALTRFRVSCHKLHIETGRYSIPKLPVDKRICRVCNQNSVEDEFHFLTECPFYDSLRTVLYNYCIKNCKSFLSLDNVNKFIWLLSNENSTVCAYLATFVHQGFTLRDQHLQSQ